MESELEKSFEKQEEATLDDLCGTGQKILAFGLLVGGPLYALGHDIGGAILGACAATYFGTEVFSTFVDTIQSYRKEKKA